MRGQAAKQTPVFQLELTSWEDGHQVTTELHKLDRWRVQAAHQFKLRLSTASLYIHQQVGS